MRIVTLHLAHIITHIWLRIPSKDRERQLVSPVTMPNGAMGTILIKFKFSHLTHNPERSDDVVPANSDGDPCLCQF